MRTKWRILSLFVSAICAIAIFASIIAVARKGDNKIVYAKSINFAGNIKSAEIVIGNNLIISNSIVEIKPSNCKFAPIFSIKKSTTDAEIEINEGAYTFTELGTFTLICKVKSSEAYYTNAKLTINVVNEPTSSTSMYVLPTSSATFTLGDEVNINSIATIDCPNNANIKYEHTNNISINNNLVTFNSAGIETINVIVSYNCLIISKSITVYIAEPIDPNDIQLELSIGGNILTNNIVEITDRNFNFVISYSLTLISEQEITCWTNDNIVEVISFYPHEIVLKPLNSGETKIYVRSIEEPSAEFEIIVQVL